MRKIVFVLLLFLAACKSEPTKSTDACATVEGRDQCIEDLKMLVSKQDLKAFERKYEELCTNVTVKCEKEELEGEKQTSRFSPSRVGDSLFKFDKPNGKRMFFFIRYAE